MRETFCAGACTWHKIHLRLQVWDLFAIGEQIMRAADCKNLAESPEGDFRHTEAVLCSTAFLDYILSGALKPSRSMQVSRMFLARPMRAM